MIRETSVETYKAIESEGLLSTRRFEVYSAVYLLQPCTSGEAFAHMQRWGAAHPLSQSRARFTELRDMGVLREAGTRTCKVSGRRCIVWVTTDELPTKLEREVSQVDAIRKAERAVLKAAEDFERLFHEPGVGVIDRDDFVKTRVRLLNAVDRMRQAKKQEENQCQRTLFQR